MIEIESVELFKHSLESLKNVKPSKLKLWWRFVSFGRPPGGSDRKRKRMSYNYQPVKSSDLLQRFLYPDIDDYSDFLGGVAWVVVHVCPGAVNFDPIVEMLGVAHYRAGHHRFECQSRAVKKAV